MLKQQKKIRFINSHPALKIIFFHQPVIKMWALVVQTWIPIFPSEHQQSVKATVECLPQTSLPPKKKKSASQL